MLVLATIAVVLILGGAGWAAYAWMTRPASITAIASPSGARITVTTAAGKTYRATGRLVIDPARPGSPYVVSISLPGYDGVSRLVLRPGAGDRVVRTWQLKTLPVATRLDVVPAKASWRVESSNGSSKTGTGSWAGTLPVGTYKVTVSSAGLGTTTRQLEVTPGRPVAMSVWLDPSGQLVHKVLIFHCIPAPKGVAITPDGKQVWVTALVTLPSVAIYDPRTGKLLGGVDLGKSGAVEVIFSKDGTRAYASQMQSASVYEIDTRTFKVLRHFATGSTWTKMMALSPDGTKLYAANWSGDDISEIDLVTGKLLRRMPTVDTPRGLYVTPDGKRLFVAGFGENSLVGRLAVIDLATGKSRTFFSERGGAMRHMVADPKRNVIFTSDMGKAVIWATDMATLATHQFVKTDSHPNTIDLSPDGRVLFVSNRGHNNPKSYYIPGPDWGSITMYDSHTGKPLDAIVGGNQCTALDVSDDGSLLVFSDFLDARLRTYEVPPTSVFEAGNGGFFAKHVKQLLKPGWTLTSSGGSGSTD